MREYTRLKRVIDDGNDRRKEELCIYIKIYACNACSKQMSVTTAGT